MSLPGSGGFSPNRKWHSNLILCRRMSARTITAAGKPEPMFIPMVEAGGVGVTKLILAGSVFRVDTAVVQRLLSAAFF